VSGTKPQCVADNSDAPPDTGDAPPDNVVAPRNTGVFRRDNGVAPPNAGDTSPNNGDAPRNNGDASSNTGVSLRNAIVSARNAVVSPRNAVVARRITAVSPHLHRGQWGDPAFIGRATILLPAHPDVACRRPRDAVAAARSTASTFGPIYWAEPPMPFEVDDFYVGMIAFFSVNVLQRTPHIRTTNTTTDAKPRPFICYAGPADPAAGDEADGLSYWTCLTTTYRPNRRTLARRWLALPPATGAFAAAPTGDLIIFDPRSTFAGPIWAFAAASHKHDRFHGMLRPVLLPQGLAALRRYVKQRGGMLPPIERVARPAHAVG
jgi:hypothetical protein